MQLVNVNLLTLISYSGIVKKFTMNYLHILLTLCCQDNNHFSEGYI
jgi:hypothetical protein